MQEDVVDIWDEPIRTLGTSQGFKALNKIIPGCFSVFSLSGVGLFVYFGLFSLKVCLFKVIPLKLFYYQTFFETWRD